MKKLVTIAFLLSAVGAATAGYQSGAPVTIWTSYRAATGALGTARNSPDYYQHIGCNFRGYASSHYASCFAIDASGAYVTCYTSSADMMAVVQSLNSDDYLYFAWDANNTCIAIEKQTSSRWEPKR